MNGSGSMKERWLQPLFFLGSNPISLIGAGLTSASALTLIGFWVIDLLGHGGSRNPYLGIIVDLCLPALFLLGLLLIPIGVWFRRRQLRAAGQLPSTYPKIDLSNPVYRRTLDFVLLATFVNFVIVGTASYRGVAYMDGPSFCGQSCHVMAPEWAAYPAYHHSNVACTECHIASGFGGYLHAKLNGTKQMLMVMANTYPQPILPGEKIPPANTTCVKCHNPQTYIGDKLLFKTSYGDDEKNAATHSIVLMHVGGRNGLGALSGIHGAHMGRVEYIATDSTHQTIPWVAAVKDDGSTTEYVSSDAKAPVTGTKRLMDCTDCHNRAAHSLDTPENALNKAIAQGAPNSSLPFVHKEGLALIKASYNSQDDAATKITAGLEDFYRSHYPDVSTQRHADIQQAAKALVAIYSANVSPSMKVAWGTHPNNLGHNDYPGCFRCHDGSHNAKGGASITNDCTTCHNLIATDEANPKQLADLGLAQ